MTIPEQQSARPEPRLSEATRGEVAIDLSEDDLKAMPETDDEP